MGAKWKLNRAGLLNFWYYDDEVFEFEDGKLLLRGSNGSGKSVTMQSFLPVLLDGKKSPDRLDPFGSKSRRMADYLLGEKEISNRDERTGYLFLEYKKEGSEQYLTTGMGMQAKRNQSLKSWGFAITDNRRIGYDLDLFKMASQDGKKSKFPLSQTELETIIASGGEVVSSNKEYMALVNKYIFGFETLEAYDDLIKLLIQLRSPKLSKEFKPTVIYEILEGALPPLTDEDLRYLSDSIEQMDQTKQQLEQLEREVQAIAKIKDIYEQYNDRILADQVSDWTHARDLKAKEETSYQHLEKLRENLELEIAKLQREKGELLIQQEALQGKKKRLSSHKVFDLEEELQKKKLDNEYLDKERQSSLERLDRLRKKERDSKKRIDELEINQDNQRNEIEEAKEDLSYLAEESAFKQHEQNIRDYERNAATCSFLFNLWKKEIHDHTQKLETVVLELQKKTQIMERIREKNQDLSEAQQLRDIAQDEERKWSDTLLEEKRKLIESIHNWSEQHDEYKITSDALQEMARLVDDLYTKVEYESVKNRFSSFVHDYEKELRIDIATIKHKCLEIKQQHDRVQKEYESLRTQKEPEPERHEATIQARNLLREKSAAFAPLYELVEFKPNISIDVQRRLESALMETGMLDALVSADDIHLSHDRVLRPDPKLLSHTLADYLQPDQTQFKIPVKFVQDILQSIEMDGEALVHISEDGSYQFASLYGHALPLEEVRFIGREARKRYRLQLLAQLEKEMDVCKNEEVRLLKEMRELEVKLEVSVRSWGDFPVNRDAKTSYLEMEKAHARVEIQLEQIHKLGIIISELDKDFQRVKLALFTYSEGLHLDLTVESCQNALIRSRDYIKTLDDMHRLYDGYIRFVEDMKREQENAHHLQEEVDLCQGELNVREDKLLKAEKDILYITEQLNLAGADDIRREITLVTGELREVITRLDSIKDELPRKEQSKTNTEEKLIQQQLTLQFWSRMEASWEEVLRKEWDKRRNPIAVDSFSYELMKSVANTKSLKEKSKIEEQLTHQFQLLQSDLMEHKMRRYVSDAHVPAWMTEEVRDEWKPVLDLWKTKNTRSIIESDQRGVKISPHMLFETIHREWSLQENRLDEMDKKLYEEILLNSVGHKLRSRIRRAEQWTEKMKGLMESRDTSSGLKFSIKWRPRTAESELELDTTDLVHLLKQDTKLLSEHDLDRITNHFRSKIAAAKTWLEEKGEGQTLLQVLKMVLDYRKWFSFVLYFERTNEPRRELTNHNFFKFSGGEKAMAMYIPLFTACYSRYQEAAPHAPFVISLDEAFAGVDENNIKEMFEIVEQLEFNYIMNSQVLWGDYETVQSLAVCELVRPKNANFVTVIRYKWDGQALTMKIPEEVGAT